MLPVIPTSLAFWSSIAIVETLGAEIDEFVAYRQISRDDGAPGRALLRVPVRLVVHYLACRADAGTLCQLPNLDGRDPAISRGGEAASVALACPLAIC